MSALRPASSPFSHRRTTSSASAKPPSPPLAHTSDRATFTPSSRHLSSTSFNSASVSVGKRLMATTHGRLYTFVMFSTCCSRLGRPASSACRFSSLSASLATPPWFLSARTVATTTTASGFRPVRRHLMSRNFSAPRSAPKPASVMA